LILAAMVIIPVFLLVSLAKAGIKAGMTGGSSLPADQWVQERVIQRGGPRKIVRIDLEGIISSARAAPASMVELFQAQVDRALRDNQVAAIVVRINSPGGEVTASDLLHRILLDADAKKPVFAYLDSIAASGGYYAACGARGIYAHETTLTGSIGVIIQAPNYQELLDKVGLRLDVYKSGEMKDLLSGARPPTPAEQEHVRGLVRQTYERFLGIVAEARDKPVDELRDSPLADGRIYSGRDAKASGMVDDTGFIGIAYEAARNAAGIENPTIVRYSTRGGLFAALGMLGEATAAAPARVEIDVADRLLPRLQAGVPYYLHLP
jgi:protease IV